MMNKSDTNNSINVIFDERFEGRAQLLSHAKSVVSSAFDYVLIFVILFFEALQCVATDDLKGIQEDFRKKATNGTVTWDYAKAKIADTAESYKGELECAEKHLKNYDYMPIATACCLAYGVIMAAFVWVHSYKRGKMMGKSTVGDIYKCTDRIPIIDSLFEIPIALAKHSLSTILLWGLCVSGWVGIFFIFNDFQKKHGADADVSVFAVTSASAGYQLFKLTGGLSQYWVLYLTSEPMELEERKPGDTDPESLEKVDTFDDESSGTATPGSVVSQKSKTNAGKKKSGCVDNIRT